jgi:subtilase family serine protease
MRTRRLLALVLAAATAASLMACGSAPPLGSGPNSSGPGEPAAAGSPATEDGTAMRTSGDPRGASPTAGRDATGGELGMTIGTDSGGFGVGRTSERADPVRLGPTAPQAVIDFSFVLGVPDPKAIDAYLAGLYDPSSANFRRFLSAAEYGERFGLSLDRIERVEAWAVDHGLTVVERYAQRTAVRLRGTVETVNRLFGVRLVDEHDPATGRTYATVDREPAVPPAVADDVVAVAGLDDRPAVSFSAPARMPHASIPAGGLGPTGLSAAYDIQPLYDAGVFGADQYIAIVSFDTYLPEDIEVFEQEMGIVGAPPIERISVGEPLDEPGEGSGEVTLDIDVIRSVAPQARILNFEAPNNGSIGFGDMVDAIVADGRARIISVSWGLCDTEDRINPLSRLRGESAFQAMVAAGISLYAASGDWGAYSCTVRNPADHRPTVFWPSSSPYVVSVGGTFLSVREDGTYLDEAGWEDYLSVEGTGGGLNPEDARPDWQQGVGIDNQLSNGARQLPDISAAADPDTGYAVYYTVDGEEPWRMVGGTSGSAPFWAAITALFAEVNTRAGVGEIGFINPMLYAIAAEAEPNTVLHDVVRGGDLLHRAGPGWDYATGLGTPDVTALAGAIVEYLRANPVP